MVRIGKVGKEAVGALGDAILLSLGGRSDEAPRALGVPRRAQRAARRRQADGYSIVFNDVEQCSTTALFTARADGRSESLPPLDFCKACLWQVMDASIDLRDPNPN